MCRIAGIVSPLDKNDLNCITSMTDAMRRGGPDDYGTYINQELNIALGHRRLSLIDLSKDGHQPMVDVNEDVVIIFNGEIYNYQILKLKLQQLGYSFRSASDTEVIIYAYLQWGLDCFKEMNGMFAMALLDKRCNKIFLVRDYAGIKPLYYSFSKEYGLIFASEIRAFKAFKENWNENSDWKKYFLIFGHLPEPITTLENVQALERGTILEVDIATLKYEKKIFNKQYFNYSINDEKEAIFKIRETLTNAVERHLISDAPIGLFLSGGIDSSLLTILAKQFVGDNLTTLSIIFEDEKTSEQKYQDIIIKKTQAHHQSYLITQQNFYDALPDILDAMDQPSCDGINTYFISQKAKELGLKAVLSGLGADELFGGYNSFYRTSLLKKLKKIPSFALNIAGFFPDDKRKKLSFLATKTSLGDYLFNRGFYTNSQIAELLDCTEVEVNEVFEKASNLFPNFLDKLNPQEKVSYLETNYYMQNQLLKDTDYMSMWNSIEVRVPFLDKELLEVVHSIHPQIRYNSQQIKHLLVKAFENELPREIWDRKKQGFLFPFENWIQNVEPKTERKILLNKQHKLLNSQKLHWSRYWSFVLTESNNNRQFVNIKNA